MLAKANLTSRPRVLLEDVEMSPEIRRVESTEVSTGVTESSATSESWRRELLAWLQLALRFR